LREADETIDEVLLLYRCLKQVDEAKRYAIMFGLETEMLVCDDGVGSSLDIFELILETEKHGSQANLDEHLALLNYEVDLATDYPILATYFHRSRLTPLKLLLYSSNSSHREVCQYLLDQTQQAVDSAPAGSRQHEDFRQLLLLMARKFVQEESFQIDAGYVIDKVASVVPIEDIFRINNI